MDYSLAIPAFIAGFLMFLAPCTLPLVPGYLAYIAGVSFADVGDGKNSKKAKAAIFLNGLFFVIGFSAVFMVTGLLVGFVSASFLAPYRFWLERIGGAFVVLLGISMLGVVRLPFINREFRPFRISVAAPGKKSSSLALGAAFAFGWTPCIGPILGSILFLVSTSSTASDGAFLLFIFSTGLAVPFLLVAAAIGSVPRFLPVVSKYLSSVSVAGGILLILLGLLLLTGNMKVLAPYGYQLFRFMQYDRLLDYL